MRDSKRKSPYSETRVVTIIGPGTVLSGDIACKGTIRIEGHVTGNVSSDDSIVVLESARVKANLTAGQVIIGGEVEGNVVAHERLELTAKAKLTGDVVAPRVSIADGVLFEGLCTMEGPAPAAEPAAPKPDESAPFPKVPDEIAAREI